ncbi:MAG: GreA/GreB family elongation factor [Bdellovibrionales bacterium]
MFSSSEPIGSTALVRVKIDGSEERWLFLLAQKGGMKVTVDKYVILTLSMDSPLGRSLMGKKVGDVFEFEVGGDFKEYAIEEVY